MSCSHPDCGIWQREDLRDPLHRFIALAIMHLAEHYLDERFSCGEIVVELAEVTGLSRHTVLCKLTEMHRLGYMRLPGWLHDRLKGMMAWH